MPMNRWPDGSPRAWGGVANSSRATGSSIAPRPAVVEVPLTTATCSCIRSAMRCATGAVTGLGFLRRQLKLTSVICARRASPAMPGCSRADARDQTQQVARSGRCGGLLLPPTIHLVSRFAAHRRRGWIRGLNPPVSSSERVM